MTKSNFDFRSHGCESGTATSGIRIQRGQTVKRARARRGRAMQEFFFENLGNPARVSRVGVMRQFSTAQFNSTVLNGRFWRLNELDR